MIVEKTQSSQPPSRPYVYEYICLSINDYGCLKKERKKIVSFSANYGHIMTIQLLAYSKGITLGFF